MPVIHFLQSDISCDFTWVDEMDGEIRRCTVKDSVKAPQDRFCDQQPFHKYAMTAFKCRGWTTHLYGETRCPYCSNPVAGN